jgi:Zn-dependent oligopeptidase
MKRKALIWMLSSTSKTERSFCFRLVRSLSSFLVAPITAEKLRHAIESRGLIDTKILSEAVKTDTYKQVFDASLKEAQDAFDMLSAMSAEHATFASLVEPYHALDEHVKVLWLFLDAYHKTDGDDHTAALVAHCQPLIVRFGDHLLLDERFYQLIEAVWDTEAQKLDAPKRRSLELLIRDRKIAGVHLPQEKKIRLREINERLTELGEKFGRNAVESRKVFFHQFKDEAELGEMPAQDKEAAAAEAKSRGVDGWVFTLSPPSRLAVMRYVPDRGIRFKFLEEGMKVGVQEPWDNRPLVREILSLRREKGRLLGFDDYSEYVLQTRMAADAKAVHAMLNRLRGPYLAKAEKDIAELKTFAGMEDLQMWDVGYYANKLSQEKFKIDEAQLQNYFELEATIAGLFQISKTLFGVEMKSVKAPAYSPDIRSYEVRREGKLIGYFMLDLFARPTKRAGAWCGYLRGGRDLQEGGRLLPLVTNTCNFPKAAEGKPTLLSHYDTETLFHEFGHGLHALLSEHAYPNIENFAMEWDFVELPSQLLENWCWDKAGLSLFAKHVETGETIPEWMLKALEQKQTFLTGYQGIQQLEYASLDLELHTLPEVPGGIEELDAFCLGHEKTWQVLPVPDFYRMYASFSHVFEGEYAVGYYSYTWAEMLEADVFERFEKEGLLNPQTGELYRRHILAQGALKPGLQIYREFMGRDVEPSALLRKKGVLSS